MCWKRRVYFARINPNGTNQICPQCLTMVSKGLEVREDHCPECGYQTHRDHAAAEMVLHRGLENVVPVDNRGTEIACQVGLSGVYDLDKSRGVGMLNCEIEKLALYL
ncbi:MAG: transposase [Okeania sp. SIO2F4]|uniref:zinc ribbon domain-containing protein n=1 Tax=Okeania sp. SIO2F4 TaxID=2607790 RepID=UPI00142C0C0A|nr:zinc ribbon domain-containing protein [Okeania sp. SIO2F4]NES03536.1 transposase [Okeania sp. SIO2F4]